MKGFGSGLIWGSVFGVAGLVIASEMTPMPDTAKRAEPAAASDAASGTGTAAPEQPAAAPPDAPSPEAPAPAAPPTSTEAPAKPGAEPASSQSGSAVPADSAPAVAPATDAAEAPAGSGFTKPAADTEPTAPGADAGAATGTAPVVQIPPGGSVAPATDTTAAEALVLDLTIPASPGVLDAPASDTPAGAALGEPGTQPAPAPAAPDAPVPEAAPSAADLSPPPPPPEEEALVETVPEITPEGEAAVLPSDPPLAPVAPLPGTSGDEAERPVAGFSDEIDGVTVGRLPQISDDAAKAASASAADETLADEPPVVRYARAFDNPEGKPVFSIVLVDDGDPGLDRAKLAALPFPVTFALDPTVPNVEDLAAPYLAAKQEVVMLATAIPEGATVADLEVTFSAHAAALPEAVALLDLADGGFQNDRPLATRIVPIVKAQGRGLLTYRRGLNSADQIASREGMRAATVFRQIDGGTEPPTAIRRALDRAAFTAAQDGRVVVVGSTRPDTIAALMEWSLEGRAAGVALAPVTGALVER